MMQQNLTHSQLLLQLLLTLPLRLPRTRNEWCTSFFPSPTPTIVLVELLFQAVADLG